jgi:hypothetical protein
LKYLPLIALILLPFLVQCQLAHPKASPFSTTLQEVGLDTLIVQYSRPAVNGRKIFGDLVPYGRIWRVGANESTKFSCSGNINVMGHSLPKGTYAIYAFPEETEWQIAFHKNTRHWGDGRDAYDPNEDVFRVTAKPETIPYVQENLLITFENLEYQSVNLVLNWENTKIEIPITLDTNSKMLSSMAVRIKKDPTAQTYYEAARFLQEQGIDLPIALHYVNKALELGGDTYYFHRVKSLVEAAMSDYKAAIGSAEKSLALAATEGKDEFVRMNQKNIELWQIQSIRSKE